ncbi:MAG: hypothetical protein JNL60_00625 [Bacteroidia bacterium]|nr:hypothetical protein [Bacteroidia bacterium]
MSLKFLVLAVPFCLLFSCQDSNKHETNKSYSKIERADWLIGRWENKSTDAFAMESWIKQDDSTFTGKSFVVIGKDTVSSEILRLEQKGNDVFYVPTVRNQNEGLPVNFKLTGSDSNLLVFENPEHDFPQKITYHRISTDSMTAVISGTIEGNFKSEQFAMKKVSAIK